MQLRSSRKAHHHVLPKLKTIYGKKLIKYEHNFIIHAFKNLGGLVK